MVDGNSQLVIAEIDKKKSRLGQGRDKTGEQRDGTGGDLSIVGLVSGVNW